MQNGPPKTTNIHTETKPLFFLFFLNPQSHILVCHGSFIHIHVQCKLPHITQKGKKKKKKKKKNALQYQFTSHPGYNICFPQQNIMQKKEKHKQKTKQNKNKKNNKKIRQKPTPTSVTVYPGYATHFLQQNIRQKRKKKKEKKKKKKKRRKTKQNKKPHSKISLPFIHVTLNVFPQQQKSCRKEEEEEKKKKTGKTPPHTPTSSWLH